METIPVPDLVELAVALDRRIKNHTARLEVLKEQLREAAVSQKGAKDAKELGGKTVDLVGAKGNVAEIYFLGRGLLKTGFWLQGEEAWAYRDNRKVCLGKVGAIAGDHFNKLFRRLFKPVSEFRDLCASLLTPARARDLVAIFDEEQKARVTFKK